MKLNFPPKINLSAFPTPLEETPFLAKELGLRKLLIKRDDCTGLGLGGNKVRKLEYLIADALDKNSDVVITMGGIQSNHARLTAAAARRVGISECILILSGDWDGSWQGNMLLDIVLGAKVRVLAGAGVKETTAEANRIVSTLAKDGRKPYLIPIGGSNAVGAMGYVWAVKELAEQMGSDANPLIVLAVGSGGTLAGTLLGTKLFMPNANVLGISVAGDVSYIRKHAAKEASEAALLLGVDLSFEESDIKINEDYFGVKYAVPSEAGNQAILLAGKTEGLILDPIYTGKAMAGLIDLAKTDKVNRDRTVVFIHTGGSPGLLAHEETFKDFREEF